LVKNTFVKIKNREFERIGKEAFVAQLKRFLPCGTKGNKDSKKVPKTEKHFHFNKFTPYLSE
jgi:hypothetical protein